MSRLLAVLLIILSVPVFGASKEFRLRANKVHRQYSEDDIIAEIRFGRNLAARILGKHKLWKNEKATRYVNLIGTGLAGQMGRPDLRFFFSVLDTAEINAYAIPGGYIFITRGALELMENEAQLAGVIAHEIAHINQRHIVDKLNIRGKDNDFLASVGALAASGTIASIKLVNKLMDQALELLFETGLDKELEVNADLEGVQMLVATNYDWKSYNAFLRKIDRKLYSIYRTINSRTHPQVEDRISRINTAVLQKGIKDFAGKRQKKRFYENIPN
ncbi:MAG: M48 family metalloprotease [Proteobacteria bacterium]|nr:M48 family metalloprotease [Pseudomonadota bacterium]